MILANPTLDRLLPDLLALLDSQVVSLGKRLGQMQELSQAMLDRSQERMDELLDEMEKAQQEQQLADIRLSAMRTTLARAVKVPVASFRLSHMLNLLPPDKSADLQFRRQQVIELAQRLRSEHMRAAVLLTEASRVNRMLLEALMGSAGVLTYGQGGTTNWNRRHGVVNAER